MKKITSLLLIFCTFLFSSLFAQERRQLHDNWKIISQDQLNAIGNEISQENFPTLNWYDAQVPSTVLGSLVKNGLYANALEAKNLETIPEKDFQQPWWYRVEFDVSQSLDYLLQFEGINYKANVFLNGQQLADTFEVKNTFRRFEWNISPYIKSGKNVLAIQIYPPIAGDLSLGFVDWNPHSPDRNMGVWRPVYLKSVKGISIDDAFVKANLSDLNSALLHVQLELNNLTESVASPRVRIEIADRIFEKKITLSQGLTEINYTASDDSFFELENPKLWWPIHYGEPNLYQMKVSLLNGQELLDSYNINFGIREFSDYINESGWRAYKVNGEPFVVLGGGWADRLFLDDNYKSVKSQLELVRDMGLNTIRIEGFFGNGQHLYDLCDSLGIMIIDGWSAQWEYIEYLGKKTDPEYGGVLTPYEIDLIGKAFRDQVLYFRNHPSIFLWIGGSDTKPKPELEESYFATLNHYDGYRCYIPAASEKTSLFGPTKVKMRGPYDYEPPVYWYSDTLYGGAFGFNTEGGPGAQVPIYESLKKMLSSDNLWPINDVWDFHCGRIAFANIDLFEKSLNERYGESDNLKHFAYKAQIMNYELMRPMFEAYSSRKFKSTGIIQWMLNSAWPSMYWQLYDFYQVPTGAYFGAKTANKEIQAIYDYEKNRVVLVNNGLRNMTGVEVKIELFDLNSQLIFEAKPLLNLASKEVVSLDKLPEWDDDSPIHFLKLNVKGTNYSANNFYWLSKQEDVLDYQAKVKPWYFHTPSKVYASFKALDDLEKINLDQIFAVKSANEAQIILENNTDIMAFGVELVFTKKTDSTAVAPLLLEDNYFSLLPGETKSISLKSLDKEIDFNQVDMLVRFWNQKGGGPSSLLPINHNANEFIVSPSIVHTEMTIKFNLNRSDICELQVLDLKGRIVKNIFSNRKLQEGKHSYRIQMDGNLANQGYLVVFKTSQKQFHQVVFKE